MVMWYIYWGYVEEFLQKLIIAGNIPKLKMLFGNFIFYKENLTTSMLGIF